MKTTVKEMVAAILGCCGRVLATRGNLNNDIGVPLTLLRLDGGEDYAVIEMGANHPGEIAYLSGLVRPDVAIVNNAGPCHLEGFGDLDGVARAKGEIFQGLAAGGTAVINADDPYASLWRRLAGERRVLSFGLGADADIRGRRLSGEAGNAFTLEHPGGSVEVRLALPGEHNVRNALAAAAASLAVGADPRAVATGLRSLQGVGGRLQQRRGLHGCTLVDDTYNANPASLDAALAAVAGAQGEKWLVLGDMAELGAHAAALHAGAGERARQAGFTRLHALGSLARHAAESFGAGGIHHGNPEALVRTLRADLARAPAAPVVVLVKGSRSMRLERVVQALEAATGSPDEEGA